MKKIDGLLRYRLILGFLTILSLHITSLQAQDMSAKRDLLDSLVSEIDIELYDSSVADIRAWLDAQIESFGKYGTYDFGFQMKGERYYNTLIVCDSFDLNPYELNCHNEVELVIDDTLMVVGLNRGGFADVAAQFFRAYEILGDSTYLNAGLKTADFFIQLQQPRGNFPSAALIDRSGKAYTDFDKHPFYVARFEDGYQYRPFSLLLYAYRLTGDLKYFNAAKKNVDMVLAMQDTIWGWLPTYAVPGEPQPNPATSDNLGVIGGGSWADCATTDGFRTTVMMYHMTGDTSYLKKSAQIINWVYKTQMGNGDVRGWVDNFDENNFPIPARNHEGYLIDPRNYNRYAGTMLIWFYAATGIEKYRQLFEEAYIWQESVETPEGFAPKYSYDGEEAVTTGYRTYKFSDFPNMANYVIRNSSLESMGKMYTIMQNEGLQGVRDWFTGPVALDSSAFIDLQIEAAKRSTDTTLILRLQNSKNLPSRQGNWMDSLYLAQVKLRLAMPNSENLPLRDYMDEGRDYLARQSWLPIHKWLEPWRPPFGWSSWQYVWDVSLALGKIDTAYLNTGGRGLEVKYFWPSWDVMGNWEGRAVTVPNLLDLPLSQFTKYMSEEELTAVKPDLDTIFEKPVSFIAENSPDHFLIIYPNPANDYIRIQSNLSEKMHITICSASGTIVKEDIINDSRGTVEIPVHDLTSGIYIITIKNDQCFIKRKFIKGYNN